MRLVFKRLSVSMTLFTVLCCFICMLFTDNNLWSETAGEAMRNRVKLSVTELHPSEIKLKLVPIAEMIKRVRISKTIGDAGIYIKSENSVASFISDNSIDSELSTRAFFASENYTSTTSHMESGYSEQIEKTESLADTEETEKIDVIRRFETVYISGDLGQAPSFSFPDSVLPDTQLYLEEVYNQAYAASADTLYPDPFIAMSLAVLENHVQSHEVFLLPLVSQPVLEDVLAENEGLFSAAIQYSNKPYSFGSYDFVGPLMYAVEYIDVEQYNPSLWLDSCRLFYTETGNAEAKIKVFAEKCGITSTKDFMYTILSMRHNVGNLCCWFNSEPDTPTNRSFIPFESKRAVYDWNAAVASEKAQDLIKQAAFDSYESYLDTGVYDNAGNISWQDVASVAGFDQTRVLPDYQWWRPLYNVRFWFNYYQLRLLYGIDRVETKDTSFTDINVAEK